MHHDQTGRGPGFVLGNAGAEILLTQGTNVEKDLEALEKDLGYRIERDITPLLIKSEDEVKESFMTS